MCVVAADTTERTGLTQNGRSDEGESGGERGPSLHVAAAQPQGYFQERVCMRKGMPRMRVSIPDCCRSAPFIIIIYTRACVCDRECHIGNDGQLAGREIHMQRVALCCQLKIIVAKLTCNRVDT